MPKLDADKMAAIRKVIKSKGLEAPVNMATVQLVD